MVAPPLPTDTAIVARRRAAHLAYNQRVTEPDPLEAIERLHARGITDGLPVIPPTPELVRRFVEASGRPADQLVAVVPPNMGRGTVEKLAVNAVLAGARPEYMPVVLAA